jgi:hypothetical protein
MTKRLRLFVPLMILGAAYSAQAGPITYTESAWASGTLGSSSFTNALLILSFSGDTANVSKGGSILGNPAGIILLNLGDIATNAIITDASATIFNNPTYFPPTAGFATGQGSILDTQDKAFATYDLSSPISITSTVFFRPDVTFATSAGGLTIRSITSLSTFTARMGLPGSVGDTTPEPISVSLFGLGFAGIAALKYRKTLARFL